MFKLASIAFLNFSGYPAIKCIFLKNEPCLATPTLESK